MESSNRHVDFTSDEIESRMMYRLWACLGIGIEGIVLFLVTLG